MRFNFSALAVPERQEEIDNFDWVSFPPAAASRKSNFFLIVDETTGLKGKLVTWTTYIHGEVDGLVFAEHVTVEQSGSVKGLIFCRTLTVMGHVSADVICDSVLVRGGGVLSGGVKHKTLKIDAEGMVTGTFERRSSAPGESAMPVAPARARRRAR
jgi:cytoskeletal protein CcmA (bactofilin family)